MDPAEAPDPVPYEVTEVVVTGDPEFTDAVVTGEPEFTDIVPGRDDQP